MGIKGLPCFVFFLFLLFPDAFFSSQWNILVLPREVRLGTPVSGGIGAEREHCWGDVLTRLR